MKNLMLIVFLLSSIVVYSQNIRLVDTNNVHLPSILNIGYESNVSLYPIFGYKYPVKSNINFRNFNEIPFGGFKMDGIIYEPYILRMVYNF